MSIRPQLIVRPLSPATSHPHAVAELLHPARGRIGIVSDLNILEASDAAFGAEILILRSGWALDDDGHSRSWLPENRACLNQFLTSFLSQDASTELWLLPRAGDVVSDVPSIATLLRSVGGPRLGVVLDPAAILTPSMLERAEEHLDRVRTTLGSAPGVRAVVASGSRLGGLGIGASAVEPRLIAETLDAFDPGVPLIVDG